MRILVYAFGPFGNFQRNVSEQVLKLLKRRQSRKKLVMQVKFDAAQFQRALRTYSPLIVLGLGLHPRARKIRFERQAVNRIRRSLGARLRRIQREGPKVIPSNLRFVPARLATRANNCGTYVCNYSFWVVGRWARSNNAKFGFLHIPVNAKPHQAARYVEKCLALWEASPGPKAERGICEKTSKYKQLTALRSRT